MRSPTELHAGVDRRTVLKAFGVVTAGALAGCTGSAGGGDGGGTTDGGSGDSSGDASGTDAAATDTAGSSGGGGGSASFDGWLDGVGNYDGTVVDATGESEVEVTVGAQGNGGNLAFDPPAVRVSTGTTVVWTWTGAGGSHNVVAADGSFESELVSEEGHTFSRTFEEPGTVRYVCTPHEALGMKGAVVVE